MKTKLATCVGAAIIAGAVPSIASAHDAVVSCNRDTGQYIVTPDFQQLNPTWVIGPTTVTVTWTDGFRKVIPLPGPCVAPPPAPTPTPEITPPPPVVVVTPPPPGVTPPPPAVKEPVPPKAPTPPKKHRKPPPKRVITCDFILAHYSGTARANLTRKYGFKYCGKPYSPPVAG